MPADFGFSLDDQAKWQLILEMDRYHRKLRHIEAVRSDATDDLARSACMEHLDRVTDIYAQAGTRQRQIVRPPWINDQMIPQ